MSMMEIWGNSPQEPTNSEVMLAIEEIKDRLDRNSSDVTNDELSVEIDDLKFKVNDLALNSANEKVLFELTELRYKMEDIIQLLKRMDLLLQQQQPPTTFTPAGNLGGNQIRQVSN